MISMIQSLAKNTNIDIKFDKENLVKLAPYFDIDFPSAELDQRILFFQNLKEVGSQSLGLAHCIQHDMSGRIGIQLSNCNEAKKFVLDSPYESTIGTYSPVKPSDEITLNGTVLNGRKKWFSNLLVADYLIAQIPNDTAHPWLIYIDLTKTPHKFDTAYLQPLGMELAAPVSLIVEQQNIPEDWILGKIGTQQFFQHSNFTSYCFLTNHYSITKALYLDIKKFAEEKNCNATYNLDKLAMDVGTLKMLWERELPTLGETNLTNEFWHRRNTSYTFAKKTLLSVVQLTIELGITSLVAAHGPASQRFRDALTYVTHIKPLYKFPQDFHTIDLTD